jgi:two-component system phosphate regulon response regulator PhoB
MVDGAMGRRILVVEDEPDLLDVLTYSLTGIGFSVLVRPTGEGALAALRDFAPDIVLLDLGLPDMPGTEVCRSIRVDNKNSQPAIIMLTAKGDEIDRVVGFEVGADDYVVKPFSLRELVLRIRAILRTRNQAAHSASPDPSRLAVGPLEVHVDSHRVFVNGAEIDVTQTEIRLLSFLIGNAGRVTSREELLESVWRYSRDVSTRTVDCHVKRLRDKLGQCSSLLETVRGVGYRVPGRRFSAALEGRCSS